MYLNDLFFSFEAFIRGIRKNQGLKQSPIETREDVKPKPRFRGESEIEVVLEVKDRSNRSKQEKIVPEGYSSYLERDEGCFIIRDRKGDVQRYFYYQKEIGEAILKEGNYVSVDALRDLLLWNIDTYIVTQKNAAIGIL